ncbi:hypothetical protein MSAN_00285500 [Mycena sanguinolenta]|uniref:Uncharacterized protein n=1 Tax=Mycena sanguinolenta TaxID=230812 RepID=A0A8H6ZAX3_9AGAR|nr:hypothetical protein MSAN_00285500 [Mycena sanguinolenta]
MSSDSGATSPSAVLSDIDVILVHFGYDIMHKVVLSISESAYGIFFALAVYSIFRKGLRSPAAIGMLGVVVYLYASSVAQWAFDIVIALKGIYYLLMVPNTPLPDRPELASTKLLVLGLPVETLFVFNMILGDAVVVWRTWVLYYHRILAVSIPSLILFMSFVLAIMDTVCTSHDDGVPIPGICDYTSFLTWTLSVATNVTCTILVGLKAWQHRKMMRGLDKLPGKRVSTEKVLSLLVESGFIYSLLWLTQLIVFLPFPSTSPAFYAYAVFKGMGNQMAGMYPTIIIVIVNFRRTFWEEESPTAIANTLSTINPSGMSDTFKIHWTGNDAHLRNAIDIHREKFARSSSVNSEV